MARNTYLERLAGQIVEEVKAISPKRGDVVVLRYSREAVPDEALFSCVGALLKQSGFDRGAILALPHDMDIMVVDEALMHRLGWVRAHSSPPLLQ